MVFYFYQPAELFPSFCQLCGEREHLLQKKNKSLYYIEKLCWHRNFITMLLFVYDYLNNKDQYQILRNKFRCLWRCFLDFFFRQGFSLENKTQASWELMRKTFWGDQRFWCSLHLLLHHHQLSGSYKL